MNKKNTTFVYRGKAREARERRRTRSTLTLIATLSRELAIDLYYASDPATQRCWDESQRRRSDWSIARKQRECLIEIRSLPSPYAEQLLAITKAIWRAANTPIGDEGNPATPLLHRQAELLAEARAELAPTLRATAAAQRRVA
jgi:hypothetical protein